MRLGLTNSSIIMLAIADREFKKEQNTLYESPVFEHSLHTSRSPYLLTSLLPYLDSRPTI